MWSPVLPSALAGSSAPAPVGPLRLAASVAGFRRRRPCPRWGCRAAARRGLARAVCLCFLVFICFNMCLYGYYIGGAVCFPGLHPRTFSLGVSYHGFFYSAVRFGAVPVSRRGGAVFLMGRSACWCLRAACGFPLAWPGSVAAGCSAARSAGAGSFCAAWLHPRGVPLLSVGFPSGRGLCGLRSGRRRSVGSASPGAALMAGAAAVAAPAGLSSVVFGGSRVLGAAWLPLVQRVVSRVAASGVCASAGCAPGADRAVLRAWVRAGAGARLSVFCSGGPAWASTAPVGRVFQWAGGGPAVPLRARLARRTALAVASVVAPGAAVFFLSSPTSPGSLAAAARAARRGLSVFAFCCWPAVVAGLSWPGVSLPRCPPAPLAGCSGAWVAASFAGQPCWRWVPARGLL